MPFGIHLSDLAPSLTYAGGIGAFAASAIWKRPHIGVYYIVPLLPLQSLRFWLHGYPLGEQWIDLMLLGVAIGAWRNGHTIFSGTPLTRILQAFAIFTYLSLWWGTAYLHADPPLWFSDPRLSDWKNYMVMFVVFFLVQAAIRDVKQMKVLLVLMLLGVLVLNRSYLNTVSGRDFSHFSYDVRDAGGMGYAGVNGLAAFEAQLSVFLLGLCSFHRRLVWKLIYLGVLAISLYCLIYTLSRGAYTAFIVGAIFISLFKSRKLAIVLTAFLLCWQSVVPKAVVERVFMTKGENGELDPSAGERVTLWENAVEIFQGNPVTGTGFNTYAYMHAVGGFRDTHNIYLKVLLETGIVGFALFLTNLLKLFAAGYRLWRLQSADEFLRGLGLGLAGWMVAVIVGNCFGDRWTYIEITGFTFAIMAMVVRGYHISTTEEELTAVEADEMELATV